MRFFNFVSSFFLDLIETFVIGLSIFLVVYLFLMQPHQVSGQSMEPNFQSGDYLLTDKVSYRIGVPKRGDVVVFHAPSRANCPTGTGCDYIKRVLGLPGETVEVKDNEGVFINGKKLIESYIPPENITLAGQYTRGQIINLTENEYFVVGDNRMHSSDSRAWGPISKSEIVGRAFFRYWPLTKAQVVPGVSYSL
jgi:signal peptidase I